MSFDDMLRCAADEIEIPDSLSPDSIEKMLRAADIQQLSAEDVPELTVSDSLSKPKITMISARTVFVRTAAAAAAIVALAGGMAALNSNNAQIDTVQSRKDYHAVQVQSYGELYDIYTGLYENTPAQTVQGFDPAHGDGVEILTDDVPAETTSAPVTAAEPVITAPVQTEKTETAPVTVKSDFSDADIVKSAGDRLYYLCGSTVYEVDKTNMEYVSEVASECDPTQMYITDSTLILLGGEGGTSAEIYDIAEGSPVLLHSLHLDGRHIAARTQGDGLLIVTDLSDTTPGVSADIASFVPGYTLDGDKTYIEASDVFVPQAASTAGYTIATVFGRDGVDSKAVLGSSPDIYLSENTLYVTGSAYEDDKDVTYLTSFDLRGGLAYKATARLDGRLIQGSLAESGGYFRLAALTGDGAVTYTNIYTLTNALTVARTADRLFINRDDVTVSYDEGCAVLTADGETERIDLDREDEPEIAALPDTVTLYGNISVGLSRTDDGLILSAYEDGMLCATYVVSPGYSVTDAVSDKNAVLVDASRSIVGFPADTDMHHYYLFRYTENGFENIFTADSEDNAFERAVRDENRLMIIGKSEILTLDLDTMQLISNIPLGAEDGEISIDNIE
ncbi:MAG: beta-propeller domain-containing protein [Oscillospiraceae bacterium]|nr:beta-propeller domain-containing protein [Oscillospiraceae bacterium]